MAKHSKNGVRKIVFLPEVDFETYVITYSHTLPRFRRQYNGKYYTARAIPTK